MSQFVIDLIDFIDFYYLYDRFYKQMSQFVIDLIDFIDFYYLYDRLHFDFLNPFRPDYLIHPQVH